jgi:hypothetical protein
MYNRRHFKNWAIFSGTSAGCHSSGGAARQSSGGGWIASLRSQ